MDIQNFLINYLRSELHKIQALLSGIVLGIILFASLDGFIEKFIPEFNSRAVFYGLLLCLWIVYWLYYKFYIQKNKKGGLGIIIAIYAENNREQILLKSDFVDQLKSKINEQPFGNVINIIVLKNHISEQINKNIDLKNLHKKIKGHFYLYGNIKKRNDGESKYFLQLDGMVQHKPISIKASNILAQEFRDILPKQIDFLESFDFKGFKFTTDIVYLTVRYITGIAAFISGDPFLAHSFHFNLKEDFNKFDSLPSRMRMIKDKIPIVLSDEELTIARLYYETKKFPQFKEWLNKAMNSNSKSYGVWLLKGIQDFLLDSNPTKALESINIAKIYARNTFEWRYSKTFLLFWLEKYPKALYECKKISKQNYTREDITLNQVEQFDLDLLKNKDSKPQIYFWLGYLNYKKKNNLPMALYYFEKFEKKFNNPKMKILKQESEIYIKEIKNKMELK